MSIESDLGSLIMKLNPYTNGKKMHFGPSAAASSATAADMDDVDAADLSNFRLELQDNYADSWKFKEEPQTVNLAVRVQYRWAKLDSKGKFLCWVTDYMLIGFEGTGGGG
jgi:hypothetical protein